MKLLRTMAIAATLFTLSNTPAIEQIAQGSSTCDFASLFSDLKLIKSDTYDALAAGCKLIGTSAQAYWNHPIELTALGILAWSQIKDFIPEGTRKSYSGGWFNGYRIAFLTAAATFGCKMLVNNYFTGQ